MNRQNELINYLVKKSSVLSEVRALYLKGSIARGSGDDFSDVDFYCLVDEGNVENMLNHRMEILSKYKKILYMEHVDFGAPQVIVIYEDNIHLDFYTVHEIPCEGSDAIKVLYDPENLLSDYNVVKKVTEKSVLIENLNSMIYTAQEVYAAYLREDKLWCHRLISHMLTDLGLVYCELFQPDKPVVHLKGVWHSLPDSIRLNLDLILNAATPDRYAEAARLLLEECRDLINEEFVAFYGLLNLAYLEYMIDVFKKLESNQFMI